MAEYCVQCGRRFNPLWDYAQILVDGKCCKDCWTLTGYPFPYWPNGIGCHTGVSSKDARRRIKLNTITSDTWNRFYTDKLAGITNKYGNVFSSACGSYVCGIKDGTLFIVESMDTFLNKYQLRKRTSEDSFISDATVISEIDNQQARELEHYVVSIEDIEYFTKEGDIRYTTQVSGGGVNLEGAVVGSIIAGDAGAIIGSRQAISSTTESHDSRQTIIKFRRDNKLTALVATGFELYDYLLKNIPQKDLLSVQINQPKQKAVSNEPVDIREKLKTIKDLFENGLIDEAEYSEKKKELLQQI